MSDKPLILVLCTGNSARSQMAEAFIRKYKGDQFEAASAGTHPSTQVNPFAIQAMAEIGIDISSARTKDIREFLAKKPVRHALIVCDSANQSCPRIWPGAHSRTFIPFDDPAAFEGTDEEKLAEFRRVRNQIDQAIRNWMPESAGDREDTK